ncbi:PspC domain-containing protein [Nocardia uniformis]|uniref:PspC domain-containing protein n=1 Tax=Nocardia uniformis TaxID=53432 RepID=A0A849BZJ4_9NOCA|nr:PspC domain-containing protein [Nocardia uniformis]NNH71973.1 PspC domain-containing protein [Nocardia uniformis]
MNSASDWSSGAGRGSFGDQVHKLWQTRPVRLPRQGPIAGVAAGFGRRYNVDPVLVRVAFVISAFFGGAGIVLYLASWLLLNQQGDQASAAESLFGKGRSSQSPTKTIVLLVALGIAVTTAGPVGMGLGGSGLISFVLMLAGWWLLYQRQPEPPAGVLDPGFPADGYPATIGYPGSTLPNAPQWTGYPGTTSPYGPYTQLPDHYEPDPARRAAHDTAVLRSEAPVEQQASEHPGDDAAARTEVLPKGDTTPTEVLPTGAEARTEVLRIGGDVVESVVLRKDSTPDDASKDSPSRDAEEQIGNPTPALKQDSEISPSESGAGADIPENPENDPGAGSAGPDLRKGSETPGPHRIPLASEPVRRAYGPAPVSPDFGPTPPGWDPLGVAPLAWDLPEPSTSQAVAVQPAPKGPRSRLTPMVIGLAILAAAAAGAAAASGVDWMTPGRIGAAALAVVGLGLIVGAFLRRGYGLMVFLAPLAGFVVLASLIGPIDFDRGGMGDRVWVAQSATDLQPVYQLSLGSGTLDMTNLKLTEDRATTVDVQMGDVRVLLPDDLRVNTTCNVDFGDSNCREGITGPDTGPVLDLTINVEFGSVEVQRG